MTLCDYGVTAAAFAIVVVEQQRRPTLLLLCRAKIDKNRRRVDRREFTVQISNYYAFSVRIVKSIVYRDMFRIAYEYIIAGIPWM